MKKLRLIVMAAVMGGSLLMVGAPSASASTCNIATDPETEALVCGTYMKVVGAVCKPLEKLGGDCLK